jgi:uncharacterized membrane protein YfcA
MGSTTWSRVAPKPTHRLRARSDVAILCVMGVPEVDTLTDRYASQFVRLLNCERSRAGTCRTHIVTLPLIADWQFYAVAFPAVLLTGLSKSGFGSGFGTLPVPLMALVITVPQAAAVLLPILFISDVMGLVAFRRHVDWRLALFLVRFGLLGTVIGTLSFSLLDVRRVAGIVGVLTLLFLVQRVLFPPRTESRAPPRWAGGLLVVMAGDTSFVCHAGSPPFNAYLIPMKLPPMVFTGTMAVFFFVVNLSKWIPYAWLGLIDMRNLSTSLARLSQLAAVSKVKSLI